MRIQVVSAIAFVAILLANMAVRPLAADETLTKAAAEQALKRAVEFYRTQVSIEGAYLWRYSADLKHREGEGPASSTTAWVQNPGTPTVGEALLTAYELTGDNYYFEAAQETAQALVKGQLASGGWDYRIEFAPQDRKRYAYRVDGDNPKARNVTTLDDNNTQAALQFMMHVDRALNFKNPKIHGAVEYALQSLLKVQYPNGAWPQRYSESPNPADFPVKSAGYPQTWSRTFPKKKYQTYYTFNDNSIADTIATMFEAAEIYGNEEYRDAARKAGDFIVLAQMPEPQPAWAQQYNADMQPAWARKFEPPAVTGGESQGIIRILLTLYERTGEQKYLEPVPRALAYLKKSELPDGRLARFYELKTNKPLYFTKQYELTYSSDDMPTHYGFIVSSKIDALADYYDRLRKKSPEELAADRNRRKNSKRSYRMPRGLEADARQAVNSLDKRGAWVEEGKMNYADAPNVDRVIDTRTFIKNTRAIGQFLAASKK